MPVKPVILPARAFCTAAWGRELANSKRRVDVHLDEVADGMAHRVTCRAIGRDRGNQHDRPVARQQLETKPMRRMFSSRSALLKPRSLHKYLRMTSPSMTSTCKPRARSSVATARHMVVFPAPLSPVNHTVTPLLLRNVGTGISPSGDLRGAIGNGIHDHARGHGVVVDRIDDDEAASASIVLIPVAKDRAVQIEFDFADFVEFQAIGVGAPRKY